MDTTNLEEILPQEINVVGNASSIFNSKNGNLIDVFPTVRFNRIEIQKPESQGSRWDFLVSSEVKTFQFYNEKPPLFHSLLFMPYLEKHFAHLNEIRFETNIVHVDLEFSLNLTKKIEKPPSSGFQILSLLSLLKRKVNLFGFDWKKSPTIYDRERKWEPHDYAVEKKLSMLMISENDWNIY